MVAVETKDGQFWFYTPPAKFIITRGGSFYCAILNENEWIQKGKPWNEKGVGDALGFGDTYESIVHEGDVICVSGRFKCDTKYGVRLTHVKLECD